VKDFRRLKVWERAHALTISVYKLTAAYPKEELYGITSQMRRAAASIPTNIAEGCGRTGDGDFLSIAMGSAIEVEYLLLLSCDLKLICGDSYEVINQSTLEVQRMLGSLIRKVQIARTQS
jgi:four helix bundle protein